MKAPRSFLALLAIAAAYAGVRYLLLGGVPLSHAPLFVLNKVAALWAALLLGIALASRSGATRRDAGRTGLAVAALHVAFALPLLQPAYQAKLFAANDASKGFSALGELSLAAGAGALVLLAVEGWPRPEAARESAKRLRSVAARAVLGLVVLHAVALDWSVWRAPREWPGHLPPISMVAAAWIAGAALLASLRGVDA